MKIYKNKNVLDDALDRMRYLFDEFPNVVVGFSGGKDSTVVLNLALQIAKEKNRLPLKVLWVDQEAEWQSTVDYATWVFENPDIEPMWFQMPMVITNNASSHERYSYCWDEKNKDKWIHPKHPKSIKVNKYNENRFHNLFDAIFKVEFAGQKSCYVSGVRTEESPKRYVGLTESITYKWITWGKVLSKKNEHFTFYPIYDWSYTDVWKYIHDNKIKYNKVYDEMYRHGVRIKDMRVSNLHHETAIQNLLIVQEIEPKTWEKVSDRIEGANTIKHIKRDSFTCPKELPNAFTSWEEYALYLADNIIQEEKYKQQLYRKIDTKKDIYTGDIIKKEFYKNIINTILSSDWDFTKLANWEIKHNVYGYRKFKKGRYDRKILNNTKMFTAEELELLITKIKENGKAKKSN